MENFIEQLVSKFEQGLISRRKFAEVITLAATAVYGGSKAAAAELAAESPAGGRGSLKTLLVNHISYGCPDYRPARDFYMNVMGMEHVGNVDNNGRQATLAFGPKGAIPFNSPYGTPVTFLIVRNGRGTQEPPNANAAPRGNAGAAGNGARGANAAQQFPAPPVKAVVNHIAYTIADWDQKRVFEELKKKGLRGRNLKEPREDTVNSYHVMDPHGYDVQISGIKMSAFGGGNG